MSEFGETILFHLIIHFIQLKCQNQVKGFEAQITCSDISFQTYVYDYTLFQIVRNVENTFSNSGYMCVWQQSVYARRLSIILMNSSLIDHYNEILITDIDKFLLKCFSDDLTIDILNTDMDELCSIDFSLFLLQTLQCKGFFIVNQLTNMCLQIKL